MPLSGSGTDVVVVGGGVVGASTAYHLGKGGVRVTIVDAEYAGQATAAGAGIVAPWLTGSGDRSWERMAYAAAAAYPDLVDRLAADGETDIGYARVGALVAGADEAALRQVEDLLGARAAAQAAIGKVRRLAAGEPATLFPPLDPDVAGVHVEGAARVDGRLLREALLRAATRHGAVRVAGEALLLVDGDRVTGVATPERTYAADATVVAAGAWTEQLVRPLGHRLAVVPQRGQILHLALPAHAEETARWPIVYPLDGPYLLGFPAGRVVTGATRELGVGYDYRVTAGGVAQVLGSALRVAPGLAEATLLETRVGFRPYSTDGRPLFGPLPGVDGLLVATGLGPTGLTMGPYLGHLAAQQLTAGTTDLDPAPYDPTRSST